MTMANNNSFNTKEFFGSAYFAPITLGEHQITLGKVKAIIEENDNGDDASYISATIAFENGREITPRFYNIGAKIFCDQLRSQLDDNNDYKTLTAYLKSLEGKSVKMWVSKRTYTAKDGAVKTTLQYDFLEPTEVSNDASEDEII
jgi:hypothetical protein